MGKPENDAGVQEIAANVKGPDEEMSKKLAVRVTEVSHCLGNNDKRGESF